MKDIGTMAIRSGFLPASIKTSEQAIIIILKGRELGIPPMQAFSNIAVVNGKPTMSAELMLSMIYRNVPGAIVNYLHTDETKCVIEAQRPLGKPTTFKFTMDDAKRANLAGKGPWISYPAAMLRARCVSAMARAMFSDALSGVVYTAEELEGTDDQESNLFIPESDPAEVKEVTEAERHDVEAVEPGEWFPGEEVIGFGYHRNKRFKDVSEEDLKKTANYIKFHKVNKPEAIRFVEVYESYLKSLEMEAGFNGAVG